jgi:hypothetical protein
MKEKIIRWFVWKLPPEVLLWTIVRGFADASTGENSKKEMTKLKYEDVYKAIVKKYKLKGY